MKKLSIFLILFMVFSLAISPIVFAIAVEDGENDMIKGNNGFGNGDQEAPGNSGDHNNAENSNPTRDYPGNSKHDK